MKNIPSKEINTKITGGVLKSMMAISTIREALFLLGLFATIFTIILFESPPNYSSSGQGNSIYFCDKKMPKINYLMHLQ